MFWFGFMDVYVVMGCEFEGFKIIVFNYCF